MNKFIEKYKSSTIQLKASIWFLICSFLQKGISFITTPIFTRLLSTTEYGQYNVFNSWMSIITIFVTLQLCAGVYEQGLVKFDYDRGKFISSLQGLNFTLCLIWSVVYLLFHDFWNNLFKLSTPQMLAMLLMIWLAAVFSFWSVEQRVIYNYKRLILLTIIVSIIKPLIGILLVTNAQNKVLARIFGILIVDLICYSGLFFVQMYRGKNFFSAKYWKYALLFNIPLLPHYLSQVILSTSDRIMISRLSSESEAGIYSLACSVSMIMTIFNSSLMSAISPWYYQRIKLKILGELKSVAYITMGVVAGVNLVLIAFAPEVIYIFAPEEYHDAIWIIPPVAMSVYFMFCYDLFAKFQFYYEKTKYIAGASIIGAIINIVLNYIYIPIFGYYAAGYTTLFCYIIYTIAHYIFMRKVCKENLEGVKVYDIKVLLGITLLFLIFGFLIMLTYNSMIIRYLFIGIGIILVSCNWKKIHKVLLKIVGIRKS